LTKEFFYQDTCEKAGSALGDNACARNRAELILSLREERKKPENK
jgi:hypothetical protein